MSGNIFVILLGLLIWKIVPKWIEYGEKKIREYIKLGCNVVGVVLVIMGIVSIFKSVLKLLQTW